MCAIFGILGEYDDAQAKYALGKLSHRGPDFCGIERRKNLFFAHQRLSITDTHTRSHQPLKHKEILLSFNGEIYNFKELREELNFDFQTQSDSEVIIAAYLKWGVAFVEHLRGMFAIALLDGEKLYLFRDRLGKKPLFYLQEGNSFYFASEIKALTPFLKKKELSYDALSSYLSYLAPTAPHTFYKKIKKLAPSEMLTVENNHVTIKPYYDILNTQANQIHSKEEAIAKLTQSLEESIALRLESDAPMAALLSGGIDSATLNFYAKRFGRPLVSYTLGFENFGKYDERSNAKESAKLLGIENIQIELSKKAYIDTIDTVFETLDEPLNDPAAIPLHHLFSHIKKDGFRVVLSGEGSDELFLGYRQYFEYLEMEAAKKVFHKNWLKKYFRSNFSMNREWEWYKRAFEGEVIFRTSSEKFTDMQKNILMKRNIRDGDGFLYLKQMRERFESSSHSDESIWFSYADLQHFQAEHFLAKLDRVSMAHSIESRTPFLDHKFVELLFSVAPSLRYQDGITKGLLKDMLQDKLPPNILSRKKKGFSNPYGEYLYDSGRVELIETVNKQTGMFKEEILQEYIQRARSGRFKQHVWGLYVLSHWIERELL
ncbi:asparagine synthase (glutamine-hydrolyzing) [Sulfurimonas sp. NWX79]|uniref:asparagine synthase (glutamine-hydrolyzing) n=1 Tax=Sulfurimonas sp. NWX79 TaxID=2925412 RepID=UPI0032047F97